MVVLTLVAPFSAQACDWMVKTKNTKTNQIEVFVERKVSKSMEALGVVNDGTIFFSLKLKTGAHFVTCSARHEVKTGRVDCSYTDQIEHRWFGVVGKHPTPAKLIVRSYPSDETEYQIEYMCR